MILAERRRRSPASTRDGITRGRPAGALNMREGTDGDETSGSARGRGMDVSRRRPSAHPVDRGSRPSALVGCVQSRQ